MAVGQPLNVSGCVTKEKFLRGRTLEQIEELIGFHKGRLLKGMTVVALNRQPQPDEFELASYTQIATHRFQQPTGLDIGKIKQMAHSSWSVTGMERLVKILPTIRHDSSMDPDLQYPPGKGVPQWVVKVPVPGTIVAEVTGYPSGRYQPSH